MSPGERIQPHRFATRDAMVLFAQFGVTISDEDGFLRAKAKGTRLVSITGPDDLVQVVRLERDRWDSQRVTRGRPSFQDPFGPWHRLPVDHSMDAPTEREPRSADPDAAWLAVRQSAEEHHLLGTVWRLAHELNAEVTVTLSIPGDDRTLSVRVGNRADQGESE